MGRRSKAREYEIDLHGYRTRDAIQIVKETICDLEEAGQSWRLVVNHGHSTNANPGSIHRTLRRWLLKSTVEMEFGEISRSNPGITLLKQPRNGQCVRFAAIADLDLYNEEVVSVDVSETLLGEKLIAFCKTAKPADRIVGKFRRFGPDTVLAAIEELHQQKLLIMVMKNGRKMYKYSATGDLRQ